MVLGGKIHCMYFYFTFKFEKNVLIVHIILQIFQRQQGTNNAGDLVWTKRSCIVKDIQTDAQIQLTLFDSEVSLLKDEYAQRTVMITCVVVEQYKEYKKQLRATPFTKIEVNQ